MHRNHNFWTASLLSWSRAWCIYTATFELEVKGGFLIQTLQRKTGEECDITEAKTHKTQTVSLNKVSFDQQEQCRLIRFKYFILSHNQLKLFFYSYPCVSMSAFWARAFVSCVFRMLTFIGIKASTSVMTVFELVVSCWLKYFSNHVDTFVFCGRKVACNKNA